MRLPPYLELAGTIGRLDGIPVVENTFLDRWALVDANVPGAARYLVTGDAHLLVARLDACSAARAVVHAWARRIGIDPTTLPPRRPR